MKSPIIPTGKKNYKSGTICCLLLLACLWLTACAGSANSQADKEVSGKPSSVQTTETKSSENTEAAKESYVLSFEANTITGDSYTSEKIALSKLTMINVWATYCNPCLSEMPDLAAITDAYDPSELQMIGIISDVAENSQEGITTAKELIAETGADNYPHLLLNDSLYNNLVGSISSVPTTFFVNQKGEVLGYVVGANSKETWEEIIHELLADME